MKILIRFIVIGSLLALAACSSDSEPKPEPPSVELKTSDTATIDTPEAILFQEAKRLYRAGLYTVAIDAFESIRLNYPLSPYVEFSELKVADGRYEMRDFALAATAYEEFAKNHPASPSMPYVLLRAGNSYRMTSKGIGRDPTPLEKAQGFFTRLLKEYPHSTYSAQAKVFLNETDQALVDYQNFVINFYEHQENQKAVAARIKYFTEKYKDFEEVGRDAAVAEQPIQMAKAELSTPNLISAWRVENRELLSAEARASQASQVPESMRQGLLIADSQELLTLDLQKINCRDQKVFLYLRSPITSREFLDRYSTVAPKDGKIVIPLPNMSARQTTLDCFGKGDLTVTPNGELTLESNHSWDLMPLDYPPRLLLVQQ
ncbi:MAG: outer membrane protein assembly factor BamD [Deltaproteobacteria bacterium]|nr:outer membrane protein assembly factor BamD [Deltaproteobacteria bacterium]